MNEQDAVANALRNGQGYKDTEWTVETDKINDGRDAVRVSWDSDTELSPMAVDEDRVPHGWQIVQFGVEKDTEIRFVTLAEPENEEEPEQYPELARSLTASELRDYLAVDRFGYSQTGWAHQSEKNRSNISKRVNTARRKLDPDE